MSIQPTARQRLLESLRAKKVAALGSETAIRRRDAAGAAPLSFAQQRLWFIEQLEPGNPRFNILTAVRLKGALRIAVLGRAVDEIVHRHEALRTRFVLRDGAPVQVASPRLHIELPVVDLSAVGAARADALLLGLVSLEAALPFDFERGPLLRVRLVRLAGDHHVLILTMHQIVVDRWSRGLLVREVVALYEAFSQGLPSPLPELPIQYADFAVWQREHLHGEVLDRLLGYWREHLAQPLPVLEIPTDRPRPALQGHRGRMQYDVIPEAELERIKALAREQGSTLFMVLFAGVAALLHRYSGQEDVVLGSPIANRNRKETEDLIGFFLNMLALRLQPRGGLPFRDLLAAARTAAVEGFAHQDMPFEKLVEELALDRDLSRHPLFTVTMVLQNAPLPPLVLRDLMVSLVEVDWGTTAFDLSIFFWETALWESLESGLSLVTSHSVDLFDPTTVARMVAHLKSLLRGAAEDPARALSELPLLSAAERQELVAEWNDTAVAGGHASIPELFVAQAARRPDAVALTGGEVRLTCRELDRWSDAVAHRLRSLGLARGEVVGIVAERSLETVVGFLGILKAGGAYLPIPVDDPAPRRDFLLRDSSVSLLLVPAAAEDGDRPGLREVAVADCREYVPDGGFSSGEIDPASPAAILYTSGSTGTPKGVCIPHSAIVRLVFDNGFLELTAEDRVAQVSNLGFDAAAFEIWASLLTGAELVVCDLFTLLSAGDFSAFLARHGITTVFLTTALFDRLAREDPRLFTGLEHLLIGGEVADPGPVREVLRRGAPGRFLQMYGPTEGTVFSSFSLVSGGPEPSRSIPLGRPVGRSEVHVLDEALNPAPIGVRGRIFVGGEGVAQGYPGRPGLTAERFVPDPFSPSPGARLFDTGDLGRRLCNGEVEFCGRGDRQIKWRGLRIEPGEIEAVLTGYPGVRGAVTLLAATKSGERILVAFVAAEAGGGEMLLHALPAYLRERLPSSMVPSHFERVEAIPLTARGKIDVQKLSCREISGRDPMATTAAPRTEAEKVVADVWRDVLGREVGVFDDFFDIGGHSLQASRVCDRLGRALGVRVPVRSLFERRTVAGLAEALEDRGF